MMPTGLTIDRSEIGNRLLLDINVECSRLDLPNDDLVASCAETDDCERMIVPCAVPVNRSHVVMARQNNSIDDGLFAGRFSIDRRNLEMINRSLKSIIILNLDRTRFIRVRNSRLRNADSQRNEIHDFGVHNSGILITVEALGFTGIWAGDLSDEYYTPGRPLRLLYRRHGGPACDFLQDEVLGDLLGEPRLNGVSDADQPDNGTVEDDR
jgi:hypothetical protein